MKVIFKKNYAFLMLCVLLGITLIYTLFIMNELHSTSKPDETLQKEYNRLKAHVEELEVKAKENAENLDQLGRVYKDFVNAKNRGGLSNDQINKSLQVIQSVIKVKKLEAPSSSPVIDQCEWIRKLPPKTDVNMYAVYNELQFDDVDGGVWKQGWDIKYDKSQWKQEDKLNVVIIPHSHNDPGWILTFEEYFEQRTKSILNSVVNALSEKVTRKFIWAETSYLSLWWKQASEDMKDKLRRLVANGQLEIVTGGWVMNDEANTHYYSMIEQMIEGHEWLRANVDAKLNPINGWSIDPFGYSPTMAYLLKQMGFENMLIQRVHYRIKKYLAQGKKLEFQWSQLWDRSEEKHSKIFTHAMPFYSYDVPHTCGPDPSVCCQFDFRRMIDHTMSCPWGKPSVEITNANVEERANLLLDQYRKKNQLYAHNVILIPLGDDFRYITMDEANAQYRNYEKLIEYMNSRTDWNVNAQFGTLADYFRIVREKKPVKDMPVLDGDFFTYADRQDHYWSGYFTSRPLYKRLDRTVEYYLRTAEILFSFAHLSALKSGQVFGDRDALYKKLLDARRDLSLFQHHDGITGTAKTHVNDNYGGKLLESIKNSQLIIQRATEMLLTGKTDLKKENFLVVDDARLAHDALVTRNELKINDKEQRVYVFNSNGHKRVDVITVQVNTPYVDVYDDNDVLITDNLQVNFVWAKQQTDKLYLEPEPSAFEVLLQVELNPFEMKSFRIKAKKDLANKREYESKFFTKNKFLVKEAPEQAQLNLLKKRLTETGLDSGLIEIVKSTDFKSDTVELNAGSDFTAVFNAKIGLLEKLVEKKSGQEYKVNLRMVYYGVTNAREKSGAYLFLPDGPAHEIEYNLKWVRIETGQVRNRLCANLVYLTHCIELYPLKAAALKSKIPAVSVWNLVDIRSTSNFELALRIDTEIKNSDFYTDLNSYQFIRRKTYNKIPLQGNVYPMPSAAYIQDAKLRLTVLSAQTLGVSSLEKSRLEIFMDRRLDQDDNRGLEQPVHDNKLTSNRFVLAFEHVENADEHLMQPNLHIQMNQFDLQHPVTTLLQSQNDDSLAQLPKKLNLAGVSGVPCDVRILNIRTMQTKEETASNSVGLILHRLAYNCEQQESCSSSNNKAFSLRDLFSFTSIRSVKKTFLTFSNSAETVSETKAVVELVAPMEIQAFKLEF